MIEREVLLVGDLGPITLDDHAKPPEPGPWRRKLEDFVDKPIQEWVETGLKGVGLVATLYVGVDVLGAPVEGWGHTAQTGADVTAGGIAAGIAIVAAPIVAGVVIAGVGACQLARSAAVASASDAIAAGIRTGASILSWSDRRFRRKSASSDRLEALVECLHGLQESFGHRAEQAQENRKQDKIRYKSLRSHSQWATVSLGDLFRRRTGGAERHAKERRRSSDEPPSDEPPFRPPPGRTEPGRSGAAVSPRSDDVPPDFQEGWVPPPPAGRGNDEEQEEDEIEPERHEPDRASVPSSAGSDMVEPPVAPPEESEEPAVRSSIPVGEEREPQAANPADAAVAGQASTREGPSAPASGSDHVLVASVESIDDTSQRWADDVQQLEELSARLGEAVGQVEDAWPDSVGAVLADDLAELRAQLRTSSDNLDGLRRRARRVVSALERYLYGK